MQNSVIIGFFIFIWKKIIEIYDASFLERIIGGICSFFKKRAEGSRICSLFAAKEGRKGIYEKSALARLFFLPEKLLSGAGIKTKARLKSLRQNSRIIGIFDNFCDIPVRQLGEMLFSLCVGAFGARFIVYGGGKRFLLGLLAAALVIIIMCVIPSSLRELVSGSVFGKFFASAFDRYMEDDGYIKERYDISPFWVFFGIFFITGVAAGLCDPLVLLAALAAGAGAVFILSNTLAGLYITVVAAPLFPTLLTAGIIALTFISYIFHLITEKREDIRHTPTGFLIILFLVLAAISSAASFNVQKSLMTLMIYIIFALPFFMAENCIKTRSEWYVLCGLFVLSGVLVSAVGLYQNFFMEATDTSWIDEDMFEDIGVRVYSTLGNPNVLGQYLVLAAPVAVGLCWSAKRMSERVIYFAAAALEIAVLMLTWSRAAWVGIVLAAAFFLLAHDRRWAAIGVIAVLLMPFVLPESIISRITSIGNMGDSSTAYRVSIWIASMRMAADYWLSGIGLGSGAFERVYQNYALNGAGFALHSHNFYIELVVEMGIFALILFILIVFSSYRRIAAIKEKDTPEKNVSLAIGGALIGYMFQGVAENLWYNYRMILVFWIVLAILNTAGKEKKNDFIVE